MMDVPFWVCKFIGIPYKAKGNTVLGADCFGIVELVYNYQFKILLPTYIHVDTEDLEVTKQVIKDNKTGWVKLDKPEDNCVVLLNVAGYPVHMGLVLNERVMLHSLKGHNSALEYYNGAKWKNRIEGFYKWQFM